MKTVMVEKHLQPSITEVIVNITKEYMRFYNIKAYEINNGLCEEFAKDVVQEMESGEIVEVRKNMHTVVKFNDIYYDSVHPFGVNDKNTTLFCCEEK